MKISLEIPPVILYRKTQVPLTRRVPHNMSNMRFHWSLKNRWKKLWQHEVEMQVMVNKRKFGKLPLNYPTIEFVLYMVSQFDKDGAYSSVKPLLDCLQVEKGRDKAGFPIPGAGIIKDDKQECVDLKVRTEKVGKRKDERVIINIVF